jgi:hypothetical protein
MNFFKDSLYSYIVERHLIRPMNLDYLILFTFLGNHLSNPYHNNTYLHHKFTITMLCRSCRDFAIKILSLGNCAPRILKNAKHKLPFSVSELRVSVRSGCELCTLILDSLEEGIGDYEARNEADSWSTCSDLW